MTSNGTILTFISAFFWGWRMITSKLLVILCISLICAVTSPCQVDAKKELIDLNARSHLAYKAKKFDEALKLAKQALDATIKIYGEKHINTADAYSNLGAIQYAKRDFKSSAESLSLSLAIYPPEEKSSYPVALSLANVFAAMKNFELADDNYLLSLDLANKSFGFDSDEYRSVLGMRICSGWYPTDAAREKRFTDKRRLLLGDSSKVDIQLLGKRAKSLPQPEYPLEVKSARIGGSIPITVQIDEKGNVIEMRPVCGNKSLIKATMAAVKNAKFEPLLINGKPSVVWGVIVYNFVPY